MIHVDTGFHDPILLEFRDEVVKQWGLNLIVARNDSDVSSGSEECCFQRKTMALRQVVEEYDFDAILVSIRRDEDGIRSMERVFSPRDKEFHWKLFEEVYRKRGKWKESVGDSPFKALQDAELWDLYAGDFGPECNHVRIHPLLPWTEYDIWQYTKREELPFNPLYLSRDGERRRSLGCRPCTKTFPSDAKNIQEIILELEKLTDPERAGRTIDQDPYAMQRRRAIGYF